MSSTITVSSLFPKAKKLEYDLKVMLEQIESGKTSNEDGNDQYIIILLLLLFNVLCICK